MNIDSPRGALRPGFILAALAMLLILPACGDDGEQAAPAAIPGMDGADEVPLVETDPEPSTSSYTWSHAYQVGELPATNVGKPTAELMEDANRDPEGAAGLICIGSGGSSGCGELNGVGPDIIGETFGGPDVQAWAWIGVPEQTAAVRFTDQDGNTTWQRPADLYRLVIFPDTVADDPDGSCACRFDAIDANGEVISSVDLTTSRYIDE